MSLPTEMRIEEITAILLHFGYRLVNIKGSYYHYEKPDRPFIIIPVHQKKVSKYYAGAIAQIISKELNLKLYEKKTIRIVFFGGHQ